MSAQVRDVLVVTVLTAGLFASVATNIYQLAPSPGIQSRYGSSLTTKRTVWQPAIL